MKRFAVAVAAAGLWLTASTFGQAPAAVNQQSAQSCPMCGKDGDGKCDRCGRAAGQGRAAGRGPMMMRMRGGRGMAMRGGGMGPGNGGCMRMMNQSSPTQTESAPKTDKK